MLASTFLNGHIYHHPYFRSRIHPAACRGGGILRIIDKEDAAGFLDGCRADVSVLQIREDGRKRSFITVTEYQVWKTVFGKDGKRKYSYAAVPAKTIPGSS